jgi:hypothetical protein
MRMCLRWQPFECEEHAGRRTLATQDGVQVRMDDAEIAILRKHNGQASVREGQRWVQAAGPMHIETHFTDVWATDGSRVEVWNARGEVETHRWYVTFRGCFPPLDPLLLSLSRAPLVASCGPVASLAS